MNAAYLRKIKSGFVKTSDQHQAGLACLASVIQFYEGNTDMQQLYVNSGAAENGVNLLGLCKAAQYEGFKANGFKANIDALKGLEDPVILHISKDSGNEDFVVLYGWHKNKFIVGDPQWGIVEYREDELDAVWKLNTLMVLEPDESFQSRSVKIRLKRKWFFKVLENHKRVLFVLAVLGVINSAVLVISVPLFVERAENILHRFNNQQLIVNAALLLVLLVLFIAVSYVRKVFVLQGTKNMNLELNSQIIDTFFVRSDNNESAPRQLANLFEKAIDQLSRLVFVVTSEVPFYGLLFIVSLVYLLAISIWAGIAIVLATAVSIYLIFSGYKKMELLYISESDFLKQKNKNLDLNVDFLQKIKLANAEKKYITETVNILRSVLETKVSLDGIKHKIENWLIIIITLISLTVVLVILFLVDDKSQLSWSLTGVWLFFCFLSIYKFKSLIIDFFSAKESYDLIYNRINFESSHENKLELKDEIREILSITKLTIDKLGFAFPGQKPVFENVKLTAELGNITVINGPTGSGKSVLISLLNRLLPIQKGDITIDGKSWLRINDFNWRNFTSSVVQPVLLFNGTLCENIDLSTKSTDRKKIVSFCKEMGFDEFFNELPNGYSTPANNLSSGQKQLVGFAAALFRNPGLLLLDEPFSFMDEDMLNFCLELLHKLKNEMMIIVFTGSNKVISKTDTFFVYKMMNYNCV